MGSWRLTTKLPAQGTQVPLGHTSPEPHCTVPRSERCNYEDHNKKKVKENANNLVQHTLHWQGPVYDPNSSLTSSLGGLHLEFRDTTCRTILSSPKQECVFEALPSRGARFDPSFFFASLSEPLRRHYGLVPRS